VRLASPRRIDLGGFLAGQHQQPWPGSRRGIGVAGTLGTVVEVIQALLSEPMAPHEDGPHGQTHLLRDGSVGLTSDDTRNEFGTIGGLLSGGTGGHDTFQFCAFCGHQRIRVRRGLERGMRNAAFGVFTTTGAASLEFHT